MNQPSYRAAKASGLREHIKAFHDKIKDFACTYCAFVTGRSTSLKKHIREFHNKTPNQNVEREFACQQCIFIAREPSALKLHVKVIHDKIKDLACEFCNYITGNPGRLYSHKRVVHQKIKPFQCGHCTYRAATNSGLRSHVNAIHEKIKGLSCPYCEFTTAFNASLRRHIDGIHKNVKKFVCSHCEYKTASSSGFKLHVNNTHYNIKHLACELCSYSTAYSGNLQKHVQTHHDRIHYKELISKWTIKTKEKKTLMQDQEVREIEQVNDKDLDSDSGEESIIISEDEEVPQGPDQDIAEEMTYKECYQDTKAFVRNPLYQESSFPSLEKRVERSGLSSLFKAFLGGTTQSDENEQTSCDLCPFIGSNQIMLTSHILERHVSSDEN